MADSANGQRSGAGNISRASGKQIDNIKVIST